MNVKSSFYHFYFFILIINSRQFIWCHLIIAISMVKKKVNFLFRENFRAFSMSIFDSKSIFFAVFILFDFWKFLAGNFSSLGNKKICEAKENLWLMTAINKTLKFFLPCNSSINFTLILLPAGSSFISTFRGILPGS